LVNDRINAQQEVVFDELKDTAKADLDKLPVLDVAESDDGGGSDPDGLDVTTVRAVGKRARRRLQAIQSVVQKLDSGLRRSSIVSGAARGIPLGWGSWLPNSTRFGLGLRRKSIDSFRQVCRGRGLPASLVSPGRQLGRASAPAADGAACLVEPSARGCDAVARVTASASVGHARVVPLASRLGFSARTRLLGENQVASSSEASWKVLIFSVSAARRCCAGASPAACRVAQL
jgi:hypothetical protein